MNERHAQLIRLRDLLSKRQINFNVLTELEVFFLGTNNGGGCRCKLPPVKKRLEEFWNNFGIKELKDYENGNENQ